MIKWNEYTWYSKWSALLVFILLFPVLTFYIGMKYEQTKVVLLDPGLIGINASHISTSTKPTTTTTGGEVVAPKKVPELISLAPDKGKSGTTIKLLGKNFDPIKNIITFGESNGRHRPDGSPDNMINIAGSTDGKTLTFEVPSSGPGGILCDKDNHCIAISAMRLTAGTYKVMVTNANGTSNALVFNLIY